MWVKETQALAAGTSASLLNVKVNTVLKACQTHQARLTHIHTRSNPTQDYLFFCNQRNGLLTMLLPRMTHFTNIPASALKSVKRSGLA